MRNGVWRSSSLFCKHSDASCHCGGCTDLIKLISTFRFPDMCCPTVAQGSRPPEYIRHTEYQIEGCHLTDKTDLKALAAMRKMCRLMNGLLTEAMGFPRMDGFRRILAFPDQYISAILALSCVPGASPDQYATVACRLVPLLACKLAMLMDLNPVAAKCSHGCRVLVNYSDIHHFP